MFYNTSVWQHTEWLLTVLLMHTNTNIIASVEMEK